MVSWAAGDSPVRPSVGRMGRVPHFQALQAPMKTCIPLTVKLTADHGRMINLLHVSLAA